MAVITMISAIGSGMEGMQRAGDQLERAAQRVADGDEVGGTVQEAVAVAAMKASTEMVRTAGELIGATLHVVA